MRGKVPSCQRKQTYMNPSDNHLLNQVPLPRSWTFCSRPKDQMTSSAVTDPFPYTDRIPSPPPSPPSPTTPPAFLTLSPPKSPPLSPLLSPPTSSTAIGGGGRDEGCRGDVGADVGRFAPLTAVPVLSARRAIARRRTANVSKGFSSELTDFWERDRPDCPAAPGGTDATEAIEETVLCVLWVLWPPGDVGSPAVLGPLYPL